MNMKLMAGLAVSAIIATHAGATVITDDFSGPSLNTAIWTVVDNAGSYNTTGGAAQFGGLYTIQNSKVETASSIVADLGHVGAGDTVRVDAIVRTDQYGNGRWSMKTAIYFDNENWVGLKLGYSGGEQGIDRMGVLNGGFGSLDDFASGPNWDIQWSFIILSVELTPTEIRFYASPAGESFMNETDIDGNVSLISSYTLPRPETWVGQAYASIGKGYAWSTNHDPFLNNNNGAGSVGDSPNYIDFARLTGPNVVPEPASLSFLALGAASLFVRRRSC